MNIDKDKNKIENYTKYGEFISSFFGWISPQRQKDRGEELEKITKKEEKNKNI